MPGPEYSGWLCIAFRPVVELTQVIRLTSSPIRAFSSVILIFVCMLHVLVGTTLFLHWRSRRACICCSQMMRRMNSEWFQFLTMTSSNGNIFRVTGPLCGEFTGPGDFPTQRPATRSFDVFFDLRLNKRLSKQPWGWWFETPSWSLWRQCNACIYAL